MVLDENEQTLGHIEQAILTLNEVDNQVRGIKKVESTPSKSSASTDMILMENAQLKRSQELSQQFMNLMKYKYPELFEEITLLVAEEDSDIAANNAVDDKLLDSKDVG